LVFPQDSSSACPSRRIYEVGFSVAQDVPNGAAVAFDYCIYQLSFLP
jgi:hypothetical protein